MEKIFLNIEETLLRVSVSSISKYLQFQHLEMLWQVKKPQFAFPELSQQIPSKRIMVFSVILTSSFKETFE